MKNKFYLTIVFLFMLLPGSCKKEPPCACGVEHPENNLPWLKAGYSGLLDADFYLLTFRDTDYIIYTTEGIFHDPSALVFNCQGKLICELGGYNPGSAICDLTDAPAFWTSYARNKILLFRLRKGKVLLPN